MCTTECSTGLTQQYDCSCQKKCSAKTKSECIMQLCIPLINNRSQISTGCVWDIDTCHCPDSECQFSIAQSAISCSTYSYHVSEEVVKPCVWTEALSTCDTECILRTNDCNGKTSSFFSVNQNTCECECVADTSICKVINPMYKFYCKVILSSCLLHRNHCISTSPYVDVYVHQQRVFVLKTLC